MGVQGEDGLGSVERAPPTIETLGAFKEIDRSIIFPLPLSPVGYRPLVNVDQYNCSWLHQRIEREVFNSNNATPVVARHKSKRWKERRLVRGTLGEYLIRKPVLSAVFQRSRV